MTTNSWCINCEHDKGDSQDERITFCSPECVEEYVSNILPEPSLMAKEPSLLSRLLSYRYKETIADSLIESDEIPGYNGADWDDLFTPSGATDMKVLKRRAS